MTNYLSKYTILEFKQIFNSWTNPPLTALELHDALHYGWSIRKNAELPSPNALVLYTYWCRNERLGYYLKIESFEPNINADILEKLIKEYEEKYKSWKKISKTSDQITSDFIKEQNNTTNKKETNEMMNNNFMNGMFGKIESGKCRLTMNGTIAIQTSTGYKAYNMKTGRLTNCSNFVFDIGDDFFFLLPTSKVKKGDIIIVGGKPKCVIDVQKEEIKVINYENSTIDTIVPERHIFMGEVYFYGKIVSMFGQNLLNGKKGTNKIFQIMMMRELFGKGSNLFNNGSGNNGMSNMLPFLMMGNTGLTDMFEGMFDSDDGEENPLSSLMGLEEDSELVPDEDGEEEV